MDNIDSEVGSCTIRGALAIIRLNNPLKLNALTQQQWFRLASLMDEIDAKPEIVVTILTGTGRCFSAGADISSRPVQSTANNRLHWLQNLVAMNFYLTHAFATHSKILVAALNGPAVGGGAAVAAFADFINAAPHTYLLTPFAALGLVTEIGTSHTLVQKLGTSLANEALLMGRRIGAAELLRCGFVAKIIDAGPGEDRRFLDLGVQEVQGLLERDEECLCAESLLKTKQLIRRSDREAIARQNVAEVFAGWERLASGVVDREMRKLAAGEKRHKL